MDARAEKRFVALMDADGCIYNIRYTYLYLYLIANYGNNFIFKYGKTPDAYRANEAFVKKKAGEIIPEIERLEAQPGDEVALVDKVLTQLGFETREHLEQEKIHVLIIDAIKRYQGFVKNLGETGHALIDAILIKANENFFKLIQARMSSDQISAFTLMSASNRQTLHLDRCNSVENSTGLFCLDILKIRDHVNQILASFPRRIACEFDGMMMPDIFNQLQWGESHQCFIKAAGLNEEIGLKHSYDETKLSLIYALMHYLADKYSNEQISIAYFEDREDIIHTLIPVFEKNPELIPTTIEFECWHYEGDLPVKIFSMQGLGEIDRNFRSNTEKMFSMLKPRHLDDFSGEVKEDLRDTIISTNIATQLDIGCWKRARVLEKKQAKQMVDALVVGMQYLFFSDEKNTRPGSSQQQIPRNKPANLL